MINVHVYKWPEWLIDGQDVTRIINTFLQVSFGDQDKSSQV